MLRVGLTGGIATGKSHVRRRFEALGLATLDLDQVTHELLAAGAPGQRAVAEAFGPGVLAPDGGVDRRALGALVFREAAARAHLNALLHPLIRQEGEIRADGLFAAGVPLVVTEAALLVETGQHLMRFDRLIVVHCPEAEQRDRLIHRDGIAPEAAEARLISQLPIERKRLFAHLQIDSSGTRDETDARADAAAAELLALARTPPARVEVDLDAALGLLLRGPREGPRGLTPRRLVALIAARGGLDLQACAAALDPPHDGPWYRAAEARIAGPGPETLAGPVALWCLARRGADEPFLAGAAAALARLTHDDTGAVTRAVVAAGGLFDVARGLGVTACVEREAHWQALAALFGGAAMPPVARDAELPRSRSESGPATESGGSRPPDPWINLLAALAGPHAGASASEIDEDLRRDLAWLAAPRQ